MIEILENYNIEELSKVFDIKKYDNPFYKILVLKRSNAIIGYLSFFIIYDRIEIEYIYIDSNYRRCGYANNLLKKLDDIAKKNNCTNITLEVDVENRAAINLYKKNDFIVAAVRKKYYGKNDGYLMIKKLEV